MSIHVFKCVIIIIILFSATSVSADAFSTEQTSSHFTSDDGLLKMLGHYFLGLSSNNHQYDRVERMNEEENLEPTTFGDNKIDNDNPDQDQVFGKISGVTYGPLEGFDGLTESLPSSPSPSQSQCGIKTEPRIIGGENASYYLEWPWQVSLIFNIVSNNQGSRIFRRKKKPAQWMHICGATLIDEQFVLTAAHCVQTFDPSRYIIRLGEHDLKIKDANEKDIGVTKIFRHQKYNPNTIDNDIALFKLAKKLDLNGEDKMFRKICLAPSTSRMDDFEGKSCVATGWGHTSYKGSMPLILQKVDLTVVNQQVCQAKYASLNEVTENMICAGDANNDPTNESTKAACNGDSGGPLACQNEAGVWQQVGITSWSLKCGQDGDPTVYTRVSRYESWIEATMEGNRGDNVTNGRNRKGNGRRKRWNN